MKLINMMISTYVIPKWYSKLKINYNDLTRHQNCYIVPISYTYIYNNNNLSKK